MLLKTTSLGTWDRFLVSNHFLDSLVSSYVKLIICHLIYVLLCLHSLWNCVFGKVKSKWGGQLKQCEWEIIFILLASASCKVFCLLFKIMWFWISNLRRSIHRSENYLVFIHLKRSKLQPLIRRLYHNTTLYWWVGICT